MNSLGLNQGAGNGTEAAQSATAGSTPLNMYYTIQSGDTLWKISEKFYGTGMYWEKIYQDNKDRISNPNKIYAGQEIVIQMTTLTSAEISGAEDVTYYVVQKGDTLWSIARKHYGKRRYWKKIWNANSAITNPNRIYAGQTIILPKL